MIDIKEIEDTFERKFGKDILTNLELIAFEIAYQESKKVKLEVSFVEFARATRDAFLNTVYTDLMAGAVSAEHLRNYIPRISFTESIEEMLRRVYRE